MSRLFVSLCIVLSSVWGPNSFAAETKTTASLSEPATLYDTYWRRNMRDSHFFVVTMIDGERVDNAHRRTESMIEPFFGGAKPLTGFVRDIEAKPQELLLSIFEIRPLSTTHINSIRIKKDNRKFVNFAPEPGKTYRVNGVSGSNYSAIWVEDIFGNPATDVLEFSSDDAAAAAQEKSDLMAKRAPVTPDSDRRDLFQSIVGGDSAEQVEIKLGKPDRIEEDKAAALNLGAKDRYIHVYEGLGNIEYSDGKREHVFVDRIQPKFSLAADELTPESVVSTLNSAGETYQAAARAIAVARPQNQEVLDAVAESMWAQRDSKDPYMVDGAAYLTKVLAWSENGRYKQALAQLQNQAAHKKLRKYARKTGKTLPEASDQSWKPRAGW